MKRLIMIFTALTFLTACNGIKERKKIIHNYEAEYHYPGAVTRMDLKNKIFQNDYYPANISPQLKNEIKKYLSVYKKDFTLKFRLFVNNNGKMDFIKFLVEPPFMKNNNDIEEDIVNIISKHRLSTYKLNGKPIKSAFDVTVSSNKFNESEYFTAVESMPEIVGGIASLAKNIKYPEEAKTNGIQGRVFVKAYVDEKGNVTNVELIKGIGYGCDEAAINAVKKLHFIPGKQNGKPVKVQVSIPVSFRLQ